MHPRVCIAGFVPTTLTLALFRSKPYWYRRQHIWECARQGRTFKFAIDKKEKKILLWNRPFVILLYRELCKQRRRAFFSFEPLPTRPVTFKFKSLHALSRSIATCAFLYRDGLDLRLRHYVRSCVLAQKLFIDHSQSPRQRISFLCGVSCESLRW